MARLYADEHVPVQIVYALRRLGNDVVTVRETSESKFGDATPDDLVLQYAAQQQRIVLTFKPHQPWLGFQASTSRSRVTIGFNHA